MKSDSRQAKYICPKCNSQKTTKNGTAPTTEGRTQRFRCNSCRYMWTDAIFQEKPHNIARESKQRNLPSIAAASSNRSSIPANALQAPTLEPHSMVTLHHRKLELDIPLDWSSTGLLNFARAAQHNLMQATTSFGHPTQAEREWNALSPALQAYARAKQHLDFALLLQLSAVFKTSDANESMFSSAASFQAPHDQIQVSPQRLEAHIPTASYSTHQPEQRVTKSAKRASFQSKPKQAQKRSRQASLVTSKPQSEITNDASSSSVQPADDPDRTRWLETLTTFQEERQQWSQEREFLRHSVRELEKDQSRNTLRLTSVSHEFERLKKKVLEQQSTAKTVTTLESKASATPTTEAARETLKLKPHDSAGITSSSFRTMPPKFTAQEEANLERLASSLMANLVRLEGHSVRPRDLPHVTGEHEPWKAVIDHLMTLGKIDRQGEFLAISLIERLRRGLKAPSAKPIVKTNSQ